MIVGENNQKTTTKMKNRITDHWQLWIIIGVVFLILSAIARTIALDWGMSDFNANIVFIASLGFLTVAYLTFQQLVQQFITPKIDTLFNKEIPQKGNNQIAGKEIPEDNPAEKIVIDYASAREKKKLKNELKAIEIESRIIMYIGDILSPHLSTNQIKSIIDRATEFFHLTRIPDFQEHDAIELPDCLTTTDMMHFGWNIAKPFKKPNLHTAYFLKQVFAHTFRNTEVYTIEKKLRLSPLSGNIKIDANVGQFSGVVQGKELKTKQAKISKDGLSAREAALADMDCGDITDIFEMEEVLIDSDY